MSAPICAQVSPTAFRLNEALVRENAALKRRVAQLEAQLERQDERKAQREVPPEQGVFYVIQLDPEHRPARIKLGWARNPYRRLATHRCAAPGAVFLTFWPCLRSDESHTITRLTARGCRRISREVFDVDDLAGFQRQYFRKQRQFEWPLVVPYRQRAARRRGDTGTS